MLVLSMVNFQVTLIIGCFSAVNVLFVGVVVIILIPFMSYKAWEYYRERTKHARITKSMFQ